MPSAFSSLINEGTLIFAEAIGTEGSPQLAVACILGILLIGHSTKAVKPLRRYSNRAVTCTNILIEQLYVSYYACSHFIYYLKFICFVAHIQSVI